MATDKVHFACNGCGACCKQRLIPLTLEEARQWLERGGHVAVMLEAFAAEEHPVNPAQYAHNVVRGAQIDCGSSTVYVIAIFAGNALTQCPNLKPDNLCGIYEQRPLVCRIYPAEISPFIKMNPADKICPPEVWGIGELIHSDGGPTGVLPRLIEQSRTADRHDADVKIAICEFMGMITAAWKDNALAIYLPDREQLLTAMREAAADAALLGASKWTLRVDDPSLRRVIADQGFAFDSGGDRGFIFYPL